MRFSEIITQASALLREAGRMTYRTLKREFALDDEMLEDLKDELIVARRVARDEDGKVLVWTGNSSPESRVQRPESKKVQSSRSKVQSQETQPLAAERRQLTVMFCDLVGSTRMSGQLDPEELRDVVREYQQACTEVIRRHEGYIAQHLGDGLLVYFGYPIAHEDDAARAVRAGLDIIQALSRQEKRPSLHVRIGIHTGLVVIGEIGSSEKREMLALGETPNIAARVQGQAAPDEVLISAATYRLVEGLFDTEERGQPELKGVATPLMLYRIVKESDARSRFEVAVRTGLTPLVGREEELGLLQRRWTQAKDGAGQVVLLSGEAGIGKSRLVQTLKEQAVAEGVTRIEFRCLPYYQNSALYPIIDHLHRLLQFQREDTPDTKLGKLQQALAAFRFPQSDTLSLLATLLSLPHPEGISPLTLSPQAQKQKTHEALVAWMMEEAQRRAVYCAWEDLHWADPSTLDVLTLFLEQIPTTRMFALLTYRPEFNPPWSARSYLTQLTLNRLGRAQVEAMVRNVTDGKALPTDIVQQIVTKTDGVPLFVEELTKMVLESGLVQTEDGRFVRASGSAAMPPLAIPSTLQDSLMARLDRLAPVREIAQIGAVLGREFSYELLQAVPVLDATVLQQGLRQLVEAELIYPRGLPPQATYVFKHALIQDTAYQSLLKRKRQQYHQQIAQVLEEQFAETKETQPELLAHHYTEAGLTQQAIPAWQKAGQNAVGRSANAEAISHLTKGLELVKTLPNTRERAQQELTLQIALGAPLMATQGYSAIAVEQTYNRAQELCLQVGDAVQVAQVLYGLFAFHGVRGNLTTALALGEQVLTTANRQQDATLALIAHAVVGTCLFRLGEFDRAQAQLAHAVARHNPAHHSDLIYRVGQDPALMALGYAAETLWCRGYPDQSLERARDGLAKAEALSHPLSVVEALAHVGVIHLNRREVQEANTQTEMLLALAHQHGFALWTGLGTSLQGLILIEHAAQSGERAQRETGVKTLQEMLATMQAMAAEVTVPLLQGTLAQGYAQDGQVDEGLIAIEHALDVVEKNNERTHEAELYRLKGEFTLQKLSAVCSQSSVPNPRHLTPSLQAEAEECFLKAIDIARKQQAKSWELRATTSLARLWQQQDKRVEARKLLCEVYNWFTEGFDTKDLQEAEVLLNTLA